MELLIDFVKIYIARWLLMVMSWFTQIEKKVIFSSFSGEQYSDSPRAISEKLHEMYPDFQIVWVLNSGKDNYGVVPDYVKIVSSGTLKYYKEFVTSCAFAVNFAMIPCFYKRKKQFFIQNWHGDRAFKKILYEYIYSSDTKFWIPITDRKDTDLCIAGSQGGVDRIRRSFLYEGEILDVGMPRNDKLVIRDFDNEQKTRQRLNLPKNTKVLLYAPTFRDDGADYQDVLVDLKELVAFLESDGQQWICLVRAHSAIDGLDYDYDGKKYLNVTDYPDMADLLAVADFLITDYSSSAGDFVLTGKPLILAAFDKEAYMRKCRTFAIDIEEPGFIVAKDQSQLMHIVRTYTEADYAESCDEVRRFYGERETGRSAEEICRRIYEFYQSLGRSK